MSASDPQRRRRREGERGKWNALASEALRAAECALLSGGMPPRKARGYGRDCRVCVFVRV